MGKKGGGYDGIVREQQNILRRTDIASDKKVYKTFLEKNRNYMSMKKKLSRWKV